MKRIAIFCDGTWNRPDAEHLTNVAKLSNATMRVGTDPKTGADISQMVIYVPGVGTGRGSSWISRKIDQYGGGAFGWGLDATLMEAYSHLAANYEIGDEIYIFGFSRGAFTARSLAGLIRTAGLPTPDQISNIPKALEQYRKRTGKTHPDDDGPMEFRRGFSKHLATSGDDVDDRKARGLPAHLLKIAYLGVWDTVGALGVPNSLLISGFFNKRYKFHDLQLSSSVLAARHAVAVDEQRRSFLPTVWDNLEDLNHKLGAGKPEKYFQQWFPGTHGAVGGGGGIIGLSAGTLQWVAQGAQEAGLEINLAMLEPDYAQIDPVQTPLDNKLVKTAGLGSVLQRFSVDRPPPRHEGEVSDHTRTRLAQADYRPKTLEDFFPD